MKKKVFISPERRPSPHGPYAVGGVSEHDVMNEIGELLEVELINNDFESTLITDSKVQLAQRVNMANSGKYDYYIALHSNASADGKASGTLMLYYNAPASINANRFVYDELIKLYPSVMGMANYSSFLENNATNMVSCYPEIAFHDNPKDAKFILDNKPQIASAICKGICKYFNREYIPLKPPEEMPGGNGSAENEALEKENAELKAKLAEIAKIASE